MASSQKRDVSRFTVTFCASVMGGIVPVNLPEGRALQPAVPNFPFRGNHLVANTGIPAIATSKAPALTETAALLIQPAKSRTS